jgi:hypothetical protein
MEIMNNRVVIDLETSMDFKTAQETSGLRELNLITLAHQDWIAITKHNGMACRWVESEAAELWAYLADKTVCGWNINEFDLPIIYARAMSIKSHQPALAKTYDLFAELKRATKTTATPTGVWYKLEEVAAHNLSQHKLHNSADIPQMFCSKLDQVFEHCFQDVRLEESLIDLAFNTGIKIPEKTDAKGITTPAWHFVATSEQP